MNMHKFYNDYLKINKKHLPFIITLLIVPGGSLVLLVVLYKRLRNYK